MRKILSVLMATLMFLTLLMPLSVFAENGPAPIDWENMTEEELENLEALSFISLVNYDTFEMGYIYPDLFAKEMPVTVKGIHYDEEMNTLILENVKTTDALVITAMGDDFKISVKGYNEIGSIISTSMNWGCSLEFIGEGVLEVNADKKYPSAIEMDLLDTGFGCINFEHNVNARLVAGVDPYSNEKCPAIVVYGSSTEKSDAVFRLGDKVVKPEADVVEEDQITIYEQKSVKIVDEYYGEELYLEKDGKIYIAELYSEEEKTYILMEVIFDEKLDEYIVLLPEEDIEAVKIDSYKKLSILKAPKRLLVIFPDYIDFDVCIDENDKECVFVDYLGDQSYMEVYQVVEHETYGTLALSYCPTSSYKELKVVGTTTVYDHYNYSDEIIINEFASTVPEKVTLKKAANAYGGVKVTWNEVDGASRYKVYRSQYNAETKKWSKWAGVGYSSADSYLDKTAKNGVKYKYTVRAENRIGLGGYDKTGVSTTYIPAPTVKIANASNGIKVSWSKVSGATGYTVYRSQYQNGKWSGWKNMGTAKADKSSWTDKNVTSGVQYKYTVRTIKNKLASGYKGTSGLVFLSQPTVKIANASTGVKVSWSKVNGATGYIVYRSELSNGKWSSWKNLGTIDPTTSYTDKTVKSGVQYKYTVRAVNGGSKSTYKATSGLLYLAQPTVKIANATKGVKVSWSKSAGATGYTVYRSQYSDGKWSKWKDMGTAKADKTSWTDKNVTSGVQYKYTVRAVNDKVKSSYKATSGLVFISAPSLKATNASYGVKVSWSKVAGATQYKLYRSDLKDGKWSSWSTLTTLEANTTSFEDKTVAVGSVYKYTLKAVNGSSISAAASSDEIWYSYAPTINIINTDTGIMVNWEHINGAEKYIFYRSEFKNGKWTEWKTIKTVNSATEYWVDETVVPDVKYKYAIKAQKGDDKTVSKASNELVYIKTRYGS